MRAAVLRSFAGLSSSRRVPHVRRPWLRRAAPFVYVTNSGSQNVSQFQVGAGGLLAPLSPPTAPDGTFPNGVAVSPDRGERLMVADFACCVSDEYDLGAGGTLSPKSANSIVTGIGTMAVAVSPDGQSVYATSGQGVSQPGGRPRVRVLSQRATLPVGKQNIPVRRSR